MLHLDFLKFLSLLFFLHLSVHSCNFTSVHIRITLNDLKDKDFWQVSNVLSKILTFHVYVYQYTCTYWHVTVEVSHVKIIVMYIDLSLHCSS